MKTCVKCGRPSPATIEFFHSNGYGGLRGCCKVCSRDYHRSYDATHRQQSAAHTQKWREANRDKARAYSRAYEAAHPGYSAKSKRAYKAAHTAELAAHVRNRRARQRGNGGSHSAADVAAQRDRQSGRCFYCHHALAGGHEVDHVVPLALGGSNGPENLVVTCPPCNRTKNATHPMDFAGILL